MTRNTILAAFACASVLSLGIAVRAAEEGESEKGEKPEAKKLELKDLPASVQATIQKAAGSNAISAIDKETDPKTVYEAEFTVDKVLHTVSVNEAGELIEEETAVEASALPAPVAEVIAKTYGTVAKIDAAASVKAGDKSYFEVDLTYGKEKHEVQVDASGKVLADVTEPEEDEHAGDKKDKDDDEKDDAKGEKGEKENGGNHPGEKEHDDK